MSVTAPPVRFVVAVLVLWIGGRTAILLRAETQQTTEVSARGAIRLPIAATDEPAAAAIASLSVATHGRMAANGKSHIRLAIVDAPSPAVAVTLAALAERSERPARPALPREPPVGLALQRAPAEKRSSWSGQAWLFVREGKARSLAAGGQLGGSQAGGRIAYRRGDVALAARVSTPLRDLNGAEGALGVDWHPLGDTPLRLSLERRFDLGGSGRNAWAAYAAGGFFKGNLPWGTELDGYGQAGIVGAERRDLFADGAIRLGKRIVVGGQSSLVVGGGVWGAAQPGAARLDVGPRAALVLPIGRTIAVAAIEGRFRVAGDARPGSGVALTLSSDF